jgi:F-type H+-transporting ATPase subunit epsilon
MGILPQHMPLMTQLVAGEIIVRKNAENIFLAVGDGFVQVTGDRVAILTDMAIKAENIDEAKGRGSPPKVKQRRAKNSGTQSQKKTARRFSAPFFL